MPDPDLLLLDEPAASLDLGARETLVARPGRACGRARGRAAIVLVSHHVEEIPPGFDHALVLAAGRVVAAGPLDDVLRDERPLERRSGCRSSSSGATDGPGRASATARDVTATRARECHSDTAMMPR